MVSAAVMLICFCVLCLFVFWKEVLLGPLGLGLEREKVFLEGGGIGPSLRLAPARVGTQMLIRWLIIRMLVIRRPLVLRFGSVPSSLAPMPGRSTLPSIGQGRRICMAPRPPHTGSPLRVLLVITLIVLILITYIWVARVIRKMVGPLLGTARCTGPMAI